ncbi:hypothetical protein AHAS_Ahas14G0129700 [Arachis hypogaea]
MDQNEGAQSRRTLGSYTAPTPDFYGRRQAQPKSSLKTWDKLVDKFLNHYFSPRKLTQLRLDIQDFRQEEIESFHDAWKRYRMMLQKCPMEIFSEWLKLDIFCYGLTDIAKMSLDYSAGGSIHMKKIIDEAQDLIETVASN